jgi:hypothetical protein
MNICPGKVSVLGCEFPQTTNVIRRRSVASVVEVGDKKFSIKTSCEGKGCDKKHSQSWAKSEYLMGNEARKWRVDKWI